MVFKPLKKQKREEIPEEEDEAEIKEEVEDEPEQEEAEEEQQALSKPTVKLTRDNLIDAIQGEAQRIAEFAQMLR